jgi:hypothetical protein
MDSNGREAVAAWVKARVLAAAKVLAATMESADDSSWGERIPELQDAQWLADTLKGETPPRQRWPLIAIFVITALGTSEPKHLCQLDQRQRILAAIIQQSLPDSLMLVSI